MTVSRQTKKAWGKKLEDLSDAVAKATEELLVGIYDAREAGLSQRDVAYHVDKLSPTGVKAKEDKGRAIKEKRKRGPKQS